MRINSTMPLISTEVLSNMMKLTQEKKLIGQYCDEMSQDIDKYCLGVEDTLKDLETGTIKILIVYENIDTMRYILHCQGIEGEKIFYLLQNKRRINLTSQTKRLDGNMN